MKKIILIIGILFLASYTCFADDQKLDRKNIYDLQEKCGKRCDEYFKNENGNGTINDKEQLGNVSYQSHYNKKMNKCLILLNEKGVKKNNDKIYKMKTLLDVNEKKKFGFFYNFGTLTFCDVLEKKCKSEEEWNLLVKPYMEE